jgi:hypothetical protein
MHNIRVYADPEGEPPPFFAPGAGLKYGVFYPLSINRIDSVRR